MDAGAAAVEFALILPILVLLVFGIIEFGKACNTYITCTSAAREGARAGAVGGDIAGAVARTGAGVTVAGVVYGADGTGGSYVEVQTSAPVNLDLPSTIWRGASFVVRSSATMRMEGTP